MTTQRISLVLGSGGARGLAHIGVIRRLQAENVFARVERDVCTFFELHRASELTELGYLRTEAALAREDWPRS